MDGAQLALHRVQAALPRLMKLKSSEDGAYRIDRTGCKQQDANTSKGLETGEELIGDERAAELVM